MVKSDEERMRERLLFNVKESFDETDLVSDDYTLTGSYGDYMGIGITNNSTENSLTLSVGDVDIVVPAGKPFYEVFEAADTVTVTGTGLDFNAYIAG